MKKDLTLLIMAAGIGSRFGGGVKQLQKVGPGGQLIIDYSIRDAIEAGFNKIVFVIRRDIEKDFKEIIGNRTEKLVRVEYCFQEKDDLPQGFTLPEGRTKPWGTGQAVLAAKNVINEPFAVINADDYYGKQAFRIIADFLTSHYGEENAYCMAGFVLKNTLSENGGVTRGVISVDENDMLVQITETSNIVKTQTGAGIQTADGVQPLDENLHVSMNMWGLQAGVLSLLQQGFIQFLQTVPAGDIKKEFLLPVFIDDLLKQGKITVKMLESTDTWFGVTYAEDKDSVVQAFRNLTDAGLYPERF